MNGSPASPDVWDIEPLPTPLYRNKSWSKEPAPIDGELMSGWLARMAAASHIAPAGLLSILRRAVGSMGDVDSKVNSRLVHYLADQTGHDPSRFATLQRLSIADGLAYRAYLGPTRYCVACWADDPAPYVRWEWRVSLVQCCPEHNLILMKRCGKCRTPFDPLKGPTRPIHQCGECGADLRRGQMQKAPIEMEMGQRVLLDLTAIMTEFGRLKAAGSIVTRAVDLYGRGREGLRDVVVGLGADRYRGRSMLAGVRKGPLRRALFWAIRASAHDQWVERRPLPIRCWAHLDLEGPVYELPPAPVKIVCDLDLYDFLKSYAAFIDRSRGARSEAPRRQSPADPRHHH